MSRPLTIEELRRWVAFGATWRLVELRTGAATVELCECTGELVERRDAADPEVLAYVQHPPDR